MNGYRSGPQQSLAQKARLVECNQRTICLFSWYVDLGRTCLLYLSLLYCSSISQGLYLSIAGFHQVLYFLEKLLGCGTYGMLPIQQSTPLDTVLLLSTSLLMQVSAAYSTTVMEVTVLSWPLSILRYLNIRLEPLQREVTPHPKDYWLLQKMKRPSKTGDDLEPLNNQLQNSLGSILVVKEDHKFSYRLSYWTLTQWFSVTCI